MRVLAALVPLLVVACASAPPDTGQKPKRPGPSGSPTAARGLSCDNPVLIDAANEDQGIQAEKAWIRQNYPGAHVARQILLQCNGKAADAIEVTTANSDIVTLYFDISKWFGKY